MKHLLVTLALLVTACTGGTGDEQSRAPARIAILGSDGNVATFDPAGDETTFLTTDAGPSRIYSQPTWSPDGERLAFVSSTVAAVGGPGILAGATAARVGSEAQSEPEAAVHLSPIDGSAPTVVPTPFAPYYLYWSPDGTRLAFLGVDTATQRQTLGVIDSGTLEVELLDTGQPYYFAWSPASDRLLVHAGASELYYLGMNGNRSDLAPTPTGFSAPGWQGNTQLIPADGPDGPILALFDADGNMQRSIANFGDGVALGLSPGTDRVAFIDIVPGANPFELGTLEVSSGQNTVIVAESASAFSWSADGARLLFLTPDVDGDEFRLRWNVWENGESVRFERFLPTRTFVQQYLPFFGQYANSLALFSPDGGAFTFTGTIDGRGEGVWLQQVEGSDPARSIGAGEFSTWAQDLDESTG